MSLFCYAASYSLGIVAHCLHSEGRKVSKCNVSPIIQVVQPNTYEDPRGQETNVP